LEIYLQKLPGSEKYLKQQKVMPHIKELIPKSLAGSTTEK
jgi:hypothetical protein